MIVADRLTKRYGSHTAVEQLTFTVPKGSVVGFLGPNGAGKSTTLRMVAGFLPPTEGTVKVAGFDVVDEPLEARRRLGYMPQRVPLYDEMRVVEYLSFRAELKGVKSSARKAAVDRAMEQARITDIVRHLISDLSEGYKQRVALADALVASPELLILDEPTASLDPNQKVEIRDLLRSLAGEHTIFLSTHILPEVEAVCSSVVILHQGHIVAEGSPAELRARMTVSGREAVLTVRGAADRVQTLFEAMPGVHVTEHKPAGADVHEWLLHLDDAGDAADATAETLAREVVGAGFGLRSLELRGKSLESIFQDLTRDDSAAAASGKAEDKGTA